jgi:hypothetical protein
MYGVRRLVRRKITFRPRAHGWAPIQLDVRPQLFCQRTSIRGHGVRGCERHQSATRLLGVPGKGARARQDHSELGSVWRQAVFRGRGMVRTGAGFWSDGNREFVARLEFLFDLRKRRRNSAFITVRSSDLTCDGIDKASDQLNETRGRPHDERSSEWVDSASWAAAHGGHPPRAGRDSCQCG